MRRRMFDILVTVLLFFVLFSLFGLFISVRPPRLSSTSHPAQFGLPFEPITLHTSDGLALAGWFIPQTTSDKAIVALHGYPADKGNILPALVFLHDEANLLLLDFRYFGDSEGHYTTAGAKEVRDLMAAVEFLKDRGLQRIGVWGFSLGGAVALMGAAESREIKAVVAESSYAELSLMVLETYRLLWLLKHPLAFLTGIWAKLLLGVDMAEVSPANKIRDRQFPILLIHSTTDQVIPFSHALILKEAMATNPQAELWVQHGVSHGQLGAEREGRIKAFFRMHL